jgi:hypothetical protein
MTASTTPSPATPERRWPRIGRIAVAVAALGALAALGVEPSAQARDGATATARHAAMDPSDQAAAMIAAARFQDVEIAVQAGWASTFDTLGCFEDPAHGGMGVHWVNESLLDGEVDIRQPEALVYELAASGVVSGLVAHEYIVPVDAWTSRRPPRLFGNDFHRHPVLPLWVLHAWLWKDNPNGVFADWNPAVRSCPSGVPIFGQDLP